MPRYQILVEGEPLIITEHDLADARKICKGMRANRRRAFILDTATGERLSDTDADADRLRHNSAGAS